MLRFRAQHGQSRLQDGDRLRVVLDAAKLVQLEAGHRAVHARVRPLTALELLRQRCRLDQRPLEPFLRRSVLRIDEFFELGQLDGDPPLLEDRCRFRDGLVSRFVIASPGTVQLRERDVDPRQLVLNRR